MTPEISNAQYVKPALWGSIIVIILAIAAWYAFTSNPDTATSPTATPDSLQQSLQELDTPNLDSIDKELNANLDDAVQF